MKLLKTKAQKHMYMNHLTSDHVGVHMKTEVDCKEKPQTKLMLNNSFHSSYLVNPKWLELESRKYNSISKP